MINVIDRNFNYLAVIDDFESLQFTRSWSSIGRFEIHININKNNTEHLQKENIIFIDEQRAGVILYREIDAETETLIIRGLQLKSYINRYITIPPDGEAYDIQNNYSENIIKDYVINNLVNPDDAIRKFDNLVVEAKNNRGMQLKYQTRYKNLAEEIEKIANVSGLGWDIHLDLENKQFVFKVLQGRNLTGGQTENPQVIFSIEFDNIANQKLVENKLNYKGTGIVAGQGEGQNRAVEVINNDIKGVDRFEVFIDARDIEDDTMLYDRGITKLEEFKEVLSFDNEILTDTNVKYMVDYDIGDIITARNDKWGAMLDSQIMEITEVYEEDFKIMATFGNDTPTLIETIKRQLDNPISEGGGSSGVGNIDGGKANTEYGGMDAIVGGGVDGS
ncbi:MAG TPA: siphovirus ReqiPepy6 Gp37-like family protein [Tissierellaceae bacterium]|nr:siphovirus ReqiPepy6 Gp37-like family protein [Tissierellaceae bacterium]